MTAPVPVIGKPSPRTTSAALDMPHRLSAFPVKPQLSSSGVCLICTASSAVASH